MLRDVTRDALTALVREVLTSHTDADSPLTADTQLVGDLGLDSVDVMAIVADLEDQLDVRIDNREVLSIETFGELVRALERKLAALGREARAAG